ncbi:MAG TPA: DNA polymerase III subunit gamma/tau [Chthoniobacterales bacterium]
MSYQVFARKYRPQNFDDVLGQNHVTQTLKNAIQQKRLAHAYLFVGPRGTGKTSTARILAKSLNCIHGPTINPCGVCDSCKEISQGLSLDVLEIDGASNNSVDQIRELRENVRFAPVRGLYKIYIIDEVHMLSQQAFNALLKTLEEPPAHVIFVFATTEPHKVLPTILSRCQRFDLRRIPAQIIAKHLSYIAKKEEVILTQEAAEAIAVAAEGGLRDAESMLDQLVAFCGNTIRESEVLEVFGLTSEHVVADLTRSILNQKAAEALSIVHQQAEAGKDLNKLLSDLLGFFRNLLVYKIDPPSLREEIGDQARSALDELAPAIDAQRLLRLIEKISEVESTIKWASNKKLHLEIALIRAIQTLSEVRLGAVIDALASLRGGANQPAESESAALLPTLPPKKAPTAENPPRLSPEELPAAKPAAEASPAQDLPKSETAPAAEPSIESAWARLLQVVATRRPLILSWIELGSPILLDNGTFRLGFPKDQELAIESLSRPNNRKLLEDVLSEILGGRWKIVFEMREDLSLPAATTTAEEPVDPLQSFKNDPMIQKALEIFKAEIQSDR